MEHQLQQKRENDWFWDHEDVDSARPLTEVEKNMSRKLEIEFLTEFKAVTRADKKFACSSPDAKWLTARCWRREGTMVLLGLVGR